jgi:polyribonucleotide nucleotidyltransferase
MQVVDFGAFVSLPNAKEGLVHISELHHERVEAVTDYLNVGDKVP